MYWVMYRDPALALREFHHPAESLGVGAFPAQERFEEAGIKPQGGLEQAVA